MVLFGSVGVIAGLSTLQAIGQNGKDELPEIDVTAIASESAQLASEAAAIAAKASAEAAPRAASSMLEQAIFDAFPSAAPTSRSAKKTASQAADLVGITINSQGHLCARPIEMQKASDGLYGIGCVTYRDGYGRSNYLVNVRTGEVTEI